ncbi:MAG: hypothetical protein ABR969_00735 [Sedimentisphaerales bacterium]|jgi:hypothetical protein
MYKIILALPFLMLMAGCGGGYPSQTEQYNPNEQHIYVHQVDDDRNTWVDAANQLGNMGDDMHDTMKDAGRDVRRMDRDNRDTFGVLNDAQRQQQQYEQQQRENMRRAYGH